MATHSSVLAWRIPGMGKPGGLPSMGSHRVGHDWSDLAYSAMVVKKFCKGDESLKDEEHSGQLLKLTMTNGKQSSKLILLQLHETLPKNSISTILSFGIWRKLERWKNSINGYLMSWSKIKEIIILKCHFLLFCETTMNHFSIGLRHVTKDSQRRPAQWLDREAPKHFPKPDCTQKRS